MHSWHGRLKAESNHANPFGLEHQTALAVTSTIALENDVLFFTGLTVTFNDWINIHQGENHGHAAGIQGICEQGKCG
jgi:hypothetical protein